MISRVGRPRQGWAEAAQSFARRGGDELWTILCIYAFRQGELGRVKDTGVRRGHVDLVTPDALTATPVP